jgi:hypothetical protein
MTSRLLSSIVLALGLTTLSWASDTNDGGCSAPKPAEPTSAVDVPQYDPGDDDAPDPAEEARERTWGDYQHQLIASLKASSDPRDWALAVLLNLSTSSMERAEKAALLRRAAQASPNDVLVQWIVLTRARQLNSTDLASDALNRLIRIEPDNGEVWMEKLQRAAMQRDRAGVTAALSHMSAASHMDAHFPDITKLVADAFERNPMPEELTPAEPTGFSRKASPYVYAMNIAAAFALPAYQYLTVACQWDERGRNADRAPDCERIGREMSRDSDTMISQAVGFAVLRVSHTFNADDIEAARQMDWVVQNFSDLAAKPGRVAIGEAEDDIAAAFHEDWIETGSEAEAMRRRVVRGGLSPTPPDNWVGNAPRFAPERIEESDKYGAERLAKAGY